MKVIALVVLTVLVVCSNPTFAQLGFTVGTVSHYNMGFSAVAPTVGVDVQSSHVIARIWLSSADKYIGNGTTAWMEGYAVVGRKWYCGGGLLVRQTWTSQWDKTSPYPSLIAGLRSDKVEASVAVHLRDWQTENHGRGASMRVVRVFPVNHSKLALLCSGQLTAIKFSDELSRQHMGFILSVNFGLRFGT